MAYAIEWRESWAILNFHLNSSLFSLRFSCREEEKSIFKCRFHPKIHFLSIFNPQPNKQKYSFIFCLFPLKLYSLPMFDFMEKGKTGKNEKMRKKREIFISWLQYERCLFFFSWYHLRAIIETNPFNRESNLNHMFKRFKSLTTRTTPIINLVRGVCLETNYWISSNNLLLALKKIALEWENLHFGRKVSEQLLLLFLILIDSSIQFCEIYGTWSSTLARTVSFSFCFIHHPFFFLVSL